ncbi:hypothetical protein NUH30_19395 [Leptospira sp. 85282-16]|uniref:hypothetical protein n=1 Tax=Leptospira sp. 85282-16 TaxID=2971256 RepID=UPI0021BF66C4|nr:hypothetical protein [Leptospira sp. 85282-16]MCT8335861.1 hypothetical protein [Leptospira sp. 85282-16]
MLDYLISSFFISVLLAGIAPSDKQKEIIRYNALPAKEQREYRNAEKKKQIEFDTESNLYLLKNCFEDPIFCYDYKLLIRKIKENTKNETFVTEFNKNYITSFQNTKFGCFCREDFDPEIYKVCPLENSYLDLACQNRQKCLLINKKSWLNSNNTCDSEFITYIEKYKKNKEIDFDKFDNESVEIFVSLKFISLIKIRKEILK